MCPYQSPQTSLFVIIRIEFIVCWWSRDSGTVTKTAPWGALTLLRLGKKQTGIVWNHNFSLKLFLDALVSFYPADSVRNSVELVHL